MKFETYFLMNREERCTQNENNDNDNDVSLEWRNHTRQVEKLLDHWLFYIDYITLTICYTYIRAVALDTEETSICFEISHPVLAM